MAVLAAPIVNWNNLPPHPESAAELVAVSSVTPLIIALNVSVLPEPSASSLAPDPGVGYATAS